MEKRNTGLRALSSNFFDEFKQENGKYRQLIEALHLLSQFMFCLRKDKVIIYYKCDKVLTIGEKGEIQITLSRVKKDSVLGNLFNNALENAGQTVSLDQIDKTFNTKDKSEWSKLLLSMSAYIDEYNAGKEGVEKEIQQRIVLENNLLGKAETTDYYIFDTEYTAKTTQNDVVNNGRFDAVAVHYSTSCDSPQLAFIEVKAGNNAVSDKKTDKVKMSGVYDHWFDIIKFNNFSDDFFSDKVTMVQQLKDLGFLKFDNKTKSYFDKCSNDKFQMIFILSNYDQSNQELIKELEDIEKAQNGNFRKNYFSEKKLEEFKERAKHIDLRFATSSFMGYGLYDECMLTLSEFKNLLKNKAQNSVTNDLKALIEAQDVEAIKAYLKNTPKSIVMAKDSDGRNALYYAIFTRNLGILNILFDYGFNPYDIDDETGATALHLAASEAIFDLALYLIVNAKMDVNVLDKEGHNPLYYALLFLNKSKDSKQFSMCPEHLDLAWLLAGNGCKFKDDMTDFWVELEAFGKFLLGCIQKDIRELETDNSEMKLHFITFLKDVLDYCNLFWNDVCYGVPEELDWVDTKS